MKRVLFLSHIYKIAHNMLVGGISEVLNNNNYSVDHELQESVSYDCIFVFNRKELKKYEKMLREKQLPVIYLFCLSDMAEEYTMSHVISRTIILKDKVLDINRLSHATALYQEMIFPSYIPPESIPHKEKPVIYIGIENDCPGELTFLKLLPLLNQLEDYSIHYRSGRGIGRRLTNRHIKIISGKGDIREEINQADLVIGSGTIAAYAVQQGKKTVVIGERGYGGLVTDGNLEYHLSGCFQGRNGGKLDENIPLHLVMKAIEEAEKIDTRKTAEQFSLLQAQTGNELIRQIEKTVSINNRIRSNDSTLNYLFNPDYDMIKRKKRIWLCSQTFRTLYQSVNESESAVIGAFREPRSIREVLNTFPSEYEEDIREYIRELILEKILIPFAVS